MIYCMSKKYCPIFIVYALCTNGLIGPTVLSIMVLILDGNTEHVAQAWRKIVLFGEKNPICDCPRSNWITEFALYVRTYIYVTI